MCCAIGAVHLVPSSKNAWGYTYTSQYVFMAWCLVKHRDSFIFLPVILAVMGFFFLFATAPRQLSVLRFLTLRVKRPGSVADHSPLSSTKVKNAWNYTSTPPYVFMAWCLVKHRDLTLLAHSLQDVV
jgi:hypothetical protein